MEVVRHGIYGPICDGDVLWPSYRRTLREPPAQLEFERREDFVRWRVEHLTQRDGRQVEDVNAARLRVAVNGFRAWDGIGTLHG